MHIINPTIAGTNMDFSASPPNATLHAILATAMNTITEIPKYKFRFQKATAKVVSDIGTSNVISAFDNPQSPIK